MSSWTQRAAEHIAGLHLAMPPDATIEDRKAVLRDGYPFGMRSGWAYKAWLKARRDYLRRYDTQAHRRPGDKQVNFDEVLSPLDRAKAKASTFLE